MSEHAEPKPGDQDQARAADDDAPHRYDAQLANEIEPYWQDWWAKTGAFETPNPTGDLAGETDVSGRRKLYVLDMFPYPSGAGLHVGHPLGYIGTDVFARYRRMRGDNVLHPFGYDAFGLPAEQYAIETGTHPRMTTEANIATMRRQLRRLGLAHDPRREFATTDPSYYRWTQWIFLRLFDAWFDPARNKARPITELEAEFESGLRAPAGEANPDGRPWAELSPVQRRQVVDGHRLAYLAEAPVNWCPGLGTVLANEEVTAEGRSAIGNYPVFRRPLRQWMLRITAYADRLLDDLDLLDWPESIKASQRNWIGRSEGANVHFPVIGGDERITVFTTRPDTLFGATYMVLAPEHPLVDALVADAWPDSTPAAWRGEGIPHATPREAVEAYRADSSRLSERERMADTGRKTGVFTGGYALNPTTGQRIPVFVADYVLMGYGTGAIMAVPAHDQRDFDFAHKFGLPIPCVIDPPQSWLDEHGVPASGADPWSWPEAFTGDGVAVHSANDEVSLDGLDVDEAKGTIIGWLEGVGAGTGQVSYRLRDWLFSRQRYWGEPFPIVWDADGLPHALPDSMLPVELPEMEDFRPRPVTDDDDGEPQPPLARATDWATVTLDLGDGPRSYRRELNTMPQWAGSCWYYMRFLDPTNDQALIDPEIERYWTQRPGEPPAVAPVDLYVGGVEHAVLHLLYARFWHKVLFDLGAVQTPEPFGRLFNQGYILAAAYLDERGLYVPASEVTEHPDGSLTRHGRPVTRQHGKMGKSLKNSITPDEICADYGADTLRLYEMAMGPFDMDRPWNTEGLAGSYRFLQRVWRNLVDEGTGELRVADVPVEADLERVLHRTIDVVGRDIDGLRFNTAIARLMEFNNALTTVVRATGRCPAPVADVLVRLIAPLAPHITEELWHRLGHDESVASAPYPTADPELLRVDELTLPVGIDGKVRFTITVPADADEDAVRQAATERPELARWLAGRQIARVIVVPRRIVNVATKPS
jgi:leucyl-tRNA synthetase